MQEESSSSSSVQWVCPSFNVYSSNKLAEIAARVSESFCGESESSIDESVLIETGDDDDDDFEFALVPADDSDSGLVSAGDFVYSGPIFPFFNRDLLLDDGRDHDVSAIKVSLKKLFSEEPEIPSSSSSEADELERVQPGTYCFWSPKAVESSPGRCKKSKSTGSSSKRWRFLNLLRRSNSDGKDSFVFLTPSNANTAKKRDDKADKTENSKERTRSSVEVKVAGKVKGKGVTIAGEKASAHEVFYVRNRAIKEGEKRRSYLPYRQDLVGFFASVNGLGRNFTPF